jgi:hypothetical protein
MTEERKPMWPWMVAFLIGLPALYVASFGPVCWLTHHGVMSNRLSRWLFAPVECAMIRGPERASSSLFWYSTLTLTVDQRDARHDWLWANRAAAQRFAGTSK